MTEALTPAQLAQVAALLESFQEGNTAPVDAAAAATGSPAPTTTAQATDVAAGAVVDPTVIDPITGLPVGSPPASKLSPVEELLSRLRISPTTDAIANVQGWLTEHQLAV